MQSVAWGGAGAGACTVPTTRHRGHVSITARWVVELWMSCNKEKSSADAALRRERVGTRLYSVHYGRCRVDMCVLFVAIFAKNGDFRQSYEEPLVPFGVDNIA